MYLLTLLTRVKVGPTFFVYILLRERGVKRGLKKGEGVCVVLLDLVSVGRWCLDLDLHIRGTRITLSVRHNRPRAG